MAIKEIEVEGKKYTLTANRRTAKTLYSICPAILNQKLDKTDEEISIDIWLSLDILFYEMIKIAHPNIDKEKSDMILAKFEKVHEQEAGQILTAFALSVFQ